MYTQDDDSPYFGDGKMSINEFEESLLVFLPEELISISEVDNNDDWFSTIVHDQWRMYTRSNVDHAFIFNIIKNIMYAYKRYNPRLKK